LCNLWDISAELEVSKVLLEYDSIEIFDQYIRCFHGVYPRAIEILVGIISNISILGSTNCKRILSKESILKFIVQVLFYDLNDTQTLIQILRLFNTFFLNEENTKIFYNLIEIDEDFITFINYILDQSLNQDLLNLLIEFLINLFDFNQSILEKFCENSNFLQSLLNSMITSTDEKANNDEPHDDDDESITFEMLNSLFKNYFICLQFISTCENGVKNLCSRNPSLIQMFEIYAQKLLSYFDNTFDSNVYFKNEIFIKNFKCYLSIFNVVFVNSFENYLNLEAADESFKCLISNIIKVCVCFVKQLEKISNSDDELENYKFAFTLIQEFLKELEDEEKQFKDQALSLKLSIDSYKKLEKNIFVE
jgi:hypothetical protein